MTEIVDVPSLTEVQDVVSGVDGQHTRTPARLPHSTGLLNDKLMHDNGRESESELRYEAFKDVLKGKCVCMNTYTRVLLSSREIGGSPM